MARFTGMPDAWSVWRTSNRGAQSQGLNEIDSNCLEFFSENLNCAPKIFNTKVVQNFEFSNFCFRQNFISKLNHDLKFEILTPKH